MINLLPLCLFVLAMSGCATSQNTADIAFLLDGSGSVSAASFITMKTFVKSVTRELLKFDTLFAFAQYSSGTTIHVNFSAFNRTGFESQVDNISQRSGGTNTAAAIQTVVNTLFVSSAGARPDAKRFLIVITDGQSSDASLYPTVTAQADAKNITRYAIGIGNAFDSSSAVAELNDIAMSDHVFRVDSFEALDLISSRLEESIIPIANHVVGLRLKVSSTASLNETEIEEKILKTFGDLLTNKGVTHTGIKLRTISTEP